MVLNGNRPPKAARPIACRKEEQRHSQSADNNFLKF